MSAGTRLEELGGSGLGERVEPAFYWAGGVAPAGIARALLLDAWSFEGRRGHRAGDLLA